MSDVSKVLEIEQVTLSYGAKNAVERVSLTATPGQVHALVGRNGSGKTSLVRAVLGQQPTQDGRVLLFGQDVQQHRAAVLTRVGVTPEEPNIPAQWTPRFLADYNRPLYPVWLERRYFERLQRWGIDAKTPFGKLSRGQKSLVQLAVALAHEPEFLILDDPTLGLDAVARRQVVEELIVELADRQIAVLLTSHDFAGIESLATHVSLLHEGRFVLQEDVESLRLRYRVLHFQLPDGLELDRLLSPLEPLEVKTFGRAIEALVGRWDDDSARSLQNLGGGFSVATTQPSLENIFIAKTAPGAHA